MRDTVAELSERAQIISQEAGSKIAAAMKDVISAGAGIAGFAIESARDLVSFMVRRGQMTPEEADKLMREAEAAHEKRSPAEKARPTASKIAAERAATAKAEAAARANAAAAAAAALPPTRTAARPIAPPASAKHGGGADDGEKHPTSAAKTVKDAKELKTPKAASKPSPTKAAGKTAAKPADRSATKAPAKSAAKAPAKGGAAKPVAKAPTKSAKKGKR